MLKVEMTPQLLGFKVTGDYDALDKLYDAVWALTIADDDFPDDERIKGTKDEKLMSTRLLALCYDLRKAYMGCRNIELDCSGLSEETAEWAGVPFVEKNVVYSVEILYPEAMYELLALNYLIIRRQEHLRGGGMQTIYKSDNAMFDSAICTVRLYQSLLLSAVEKVASKGRFSRIRKYTTEYPSFIQSMYTQWLDIINSDYVSMTRKQRSEELSTIVRDIAKHWKHPQYLEIKEDIDAFVLEYDTPRENCEIPNLDWPDPLEW